MSFVVVAPSRNIRLARTIKVDWVGIGGAFGSYIDIIGWCSVGSWRGRTTNALPRLVQLTNHQMLTLQKLRHRKLPQRLLLTAPGNIRGLSINRPALLEVLVSDSSGLNTI